MNDTAEKPPDSPLTPGPSKHYEGYLEKKGPKDKDYEKQWIILLGDRMLVYPQRFVQRELNANKPLESVIINKNTDIKIDAKEKTKLSIKCREGQYKFKMSTTDERDNWWIRFYALAKMEIPKVNLLPGQIMALQEIIESVQQNTSSTYDVPTPLPSPNQVKTKSPTTKTFVKQKSQEKTDLNVKTKSPTTFTFVKQKSQEKPDLNKQYRFYPEHLLQEYRDNFPIPPTWFFQVSRMQAEELLFNNQDSGAILIRESESHPGEFSLTMRQDPPPSNAIASPIIKHFRFGWDKNQGTYKMLIEEQQPVMPTMYDLLAFFIDKHGGDIKPMQTRDPDVLRRPQHPYELGLRSSVKNPENGERHHARDTYLQPKRVAPEPPSRPRPDRSSLPASFNMQIEDQQGEITGAGNRLSLPTSQSNSSSYMVPAATVPLYVNVGRETLGMIREGKNNNSSRRASRYSTSDAPSFPSSLSDQRAPKPPPPRQRYSEASITEEFEANLTNEGSVYNTPTGQTFNLKRHSPVLPMATTATSSKQAGNRLRANTSPGNSTVPDELNKIFKKFGIDGPP